jgi:hypothetical protein
MNSSEPVILSGVAAYPCEAATEPKDLVVVNYNLPSVGNSRHLFPARRFQTFWRDRA